MKYERHMQRRYKTIKMTPNNNTSYSPPLGNKDTQTVNQLPFSDWATAQKTGPVSRATDPTAPFRIKNWTPMGTLLTTITTNIC